MGRLQTRPRPESMTGQLYDLFMENPGAVIDLTRWGSIMSLTQQIIKRMNDTYEVDIRYFGHGCFCLVGHVDENDKYIDHFAAIWEGNYRRA